MKTTILLTLALLILIAWQLPVTAKPASKPPATAEGGPRYTVYFTTAPWNGEALRVKMTLAGRTVVNSRSSTPNFPGLPLRMNGLKSGIYTATVTLLNRDANRLTQVFLEHNIFVQGGAIGIISEGEISTRNPSMTTSMVDIHTVWESDPDQDHSYLLRYRVGDTCKIVFFVGSPKATVHDIEALEASDNAPKNVPDDATPPDLSAHYKLADFVDKNDGQLPFSIREAYSQKYAGNMSGPDSFWFQGSPGGGPDHGPIYGHRYLAINSLGKSSLSAKEAATLLNNNIETVFPGNAKGDHGPQIERDALLPLPKFKLATNLKLFTDQLGDEQQVNPILVNLLEAKFHVHELAALARIVDFAPGEVECMDVTDYHFTFQTVPGHHALQGMAIHGVFKDASGELWMFQQGRGPADEDVLASHYLQPDSPTLAERVLIGWNPDVYSDIHEKTHNLQSHLNYTLAEVMWRIMASNLKDVIRSQSHP